MSEQRTRNEAVIEENAIRQVPERAPMVNALRNEFPHINFTLK
jgi:hypothetical protein